MNNYRVLLIRNAAPADFGGAETYPVSLAKVLADNHIDPILVTRSDKLLTYARSHSVKVIRGWWWKKQTWNGKNVFLFPLYIGWQCALILWYLQLILRLKPVALHIQSKDDFIAASLAGRILNKKIVWTDHMDLRYILLNVTKRWRNPLGKMVHWAGQFADHIIIISDNEYRLVTEHLTKQSPLNVKLVVVKNGVLDQLQRFEHTDKEECFTFCLASRIVANKGISEAIAAFNELEKDNDQQCYLSIYGDGPDLARFNKLAASNKNIRFYGHQTDALKKIFKSTVFILPSYQEGFSIALLEATMLGKPIIATNVDSNGEIIKNMRTGILVKPKDSHELARAMNLLLKNEKLRKTLETNARQNFESNFNLTEIVRTKIIPLYFN